MAINVGDFGTATATGSGAAWAATVNNNDGIITTGSVSTASGSTFTLTVTNNVIAPLESIPQCRRCLGGEFLTPWLLGVYVNEVGL